MYVELYRSKYSTVKLYGKTNFTLRLKSQCECKVTNMKAMELRNSAVRTLLYLVQLTIFRAFAQDDMSSKYELELVIYSKKAPTSRDQLSRKFINDKVKHET